MIIIHKENIFDLFNAQNPKEEKINSMSEVVPAPEPEIVPASDPAPEQIPEPENPITTNELNNEESEVKN